MVRTMSNETATGTRGRGSLSDQQDRRNAMAAHVIKRGSVTVEDLVNVTGMSLMTVYRDLAHLEEAGILQRHRGRVVAVASSLHEASAGFRLEQNSDVKESMAAVVAPLIPPGSSLLLDDSTSGAFVLRALEGVTPLTVVTNSLLVAQEVERSAGVRLIVLGGEYQAWAQALMGSATTAMVSTMRTDFCVLSASGISDGMCFHPYLDVVDVKRAMLSAGRTKILLLDHTKFARRALHAFARISDFDIVVVDAGTPAATIEVLRADGVNVLVAGA